MKKTKLKLLICIVIVILMYIPTTSNAALQANGKSIKQDNVANWLLKIRKMEATGGTLGLQDTINTTDLTSTANQSNNLDIHMELNTEYGAMAILSASAYGNQNKINSGETTTGNKSGVYINLNKERVAAHGSSVNSVFSNVNSKYKNSYTNTYVAKRGDAIGETAGWHSSSTSYWFDGSMRTGLIRAHGGSIFSYYAHDTYDSMAFINKSWASRAVVVIGNGL